MTDQDLYDVVRDTVKAAVLAAARAGLAKMDAVDAARTGTDGAYYLLREEKEKADAGH